MHRVVEGLRRAAPSDRRRSAARIGRGRIGLVGRPLAVGAPVPLVGAGRGVEHDDAVIAVAVRRRRASLAARIDPDVGRLAELGGVVVALARTGLADLHHELAVAGELQDEAVVLVVAAEPDEALVDRRGCRAPAWASRSPARPAPGLHHVALGIELDHRRRRHAALRARRLLRGGGFHAATGCADAA